MRFVEIDYVKEGMTLAKPVYYDKMVLFDEGMILTEMNINYIRLFGFHGLYIEDEISKGIVVEEVVDEHLKGELISELKRVFYGHRDTIEGVKKEDYLFENIFQNYVSSLVDAIQGKKVTVDIIDLKNHDSYTFCHSVNVAVLSLIVGDELGLDRTEMEELALASLFHDIGKLYVPLPIINKETALNHDEKMIIMQHPLLGANWVQQHFESVPKNVLLGIAQHHEKLNGNGYPFGLKDIGLFGRIIAVCDIYDALISKRSYHEPYLPSEAVEFLYGDVTQNELDVDVVNAFLRRVSAYPVGMVVKLSNLKTGIVIKQNKENICRPIVRLLGASNGLVDLYRDENYRNVTIVGVVKQDDF